MAILSEIRKRPYILIGILALGLLAFVVDPSSLEKYFGRDPNILGQVNGEKITREDLEDQIFTLQQQTGGQEDRNVLEEQAWQTLVQSKLIKQQFEKMGLEMTDDLFWNQIQFDPIFAQNQQLFDEKGNFKVQELKKELETMKNQDPKSYANWIKMRTGIEYRIMARLFLGNTTSGITASTMEANELIKQKNENASIDYVKIDYTQFGAKNKVKVTTADLDNFIKKHPTRFKTEASRNIGLVLFRTNPSDTDMESARAEINQLSNVGIDLGNGVESFQQTKNDSMFVTVNSDVPFNPQYLPITHQPEEVRDFLKTASAGQTFGPYEVEGKYLVVSKLVGKQAQDSVKARHILITFKGNPAAQGQNIQRTEKDAKKLADSINAVVKANPAKFAELATQSNDPGSAQNGGELGWVTSETPLVPEFLRYLMTHPAGATDVVKTDYGYHVINVEERKSGALGYKVANLVKKIKISDKTNSLVYTNANQFIQDVSGKSFNDFKNIAKKKNYDFQNPTHAQRFQGTIPGISTDKDAEVLAWAFDKDTKKGDTNIFTTADGDYIVAYLEGKQEKGLVNGESVRSEIEPLVLNQLLAKKIIETIKAKGAKSLDQVAKDFGTAKSSATINLLNPMIDGGMEPKVAGAAFGVKLKTMSQPIEGNAGVYVVTRNSVEKEKGNDDPKNVVQMLQQQGARNFGQQLLQSLQENAEIKDYRNEAYKKLGMSN